jgi:hypothetical protein
VDRVVDDALTRGHAPKVSITVPSRSVTTALVTMPPWT